MNKFLTALFLTTALFPVLSTAQFYSPESLSAGIYGRGETNLYRYYSGKELGSFYTNRVQNSYSAGLATHLSINHLFNANVSFGFSEVTFKPDIRTGNSILYQSSLRLWNLNYSGELKLSSNEKFTPVTFLGFQSMFIESATEIFSAGIVEERKWPRNRTMLQWGIGMLATPFKKPVMFRVEAGLRLNATNKTGYEQKLSQLFAGLQIQYRLKSW